MPIDTSSRKEMLFLLAHPDDEFGCFELIRRVVAGGGRARVVYLTDGGASEAVSSRRSAESRRVLAALGVSARDLHFVGAAQRLPDGGLYRHLRRAWDACVDFCQAHPGIDAICFPAWEGGHPDHDAVYVLGVHLARVMGVKQILQFPLYNAFSVPQPFFRVLHALGENGPVSYLHIPWRERFRYVGFCATFYPSQWKTWVGLLPFVLPKLMVGGAYSLQRADETRIWRRPHEGALLYERRGWLTWGAFETEMRAFLRDIDQQAH